MVSRVTDEDGVASMPVPAKMLARRRSLVLAATAIGVVMLIAVAGGFVYWSTAMSKTVVPSLSGKTVAEAKTSLSAAQLIVGETVEMFDDTVPEGQIIEQAPPGQQEIDKGSAVKLVVSKGPELVTFTITTDTGSDGFIECGTMARFFASVYSDSRLVDESGEVLSPISGRWTESSGNGYYFPCNVTATFLSVPTNRSEYTIELDLEDPEGNHVGPISRTEMESADWTVVR